MLASARGYSGPIMKKLALGLVLWALPLAPAVAADCGSLQTISSVALEPNATRQVEYVPVKLNGVDKKLVLDTGGYTTQLTPDVVEELKLPIGGASGTMKFVGGTNGSIASAKVADFQMGSMRAHDITLLVSPIPGLEKHADGLLASDLFLAYDIDLDFGHDKLNFISSDHCPGKVVYWQADAVADVPLRIVNGHYLIDVTLDGKRLVAMVDTGASRSSIGLAEAHRFFGLSASDMEQAPKANGVVTSYYHKFASLAFEGIEIHDPTFVVIDTGVLDRDRARIGSHVVGQVAQTSDMILGMDIMRHLHLYIATKERKLYVTPA